jgi:WD40 repeat protein
VLVSHTPAGASGNGASLAGLPGITPDGAHVVLSSGASDLVPGDTNAAGDVFLYDRGHDAISLASVGVGGAPARGTSTDPTVSADGRRVGFASFAANLVPGDGNGTVDVFVRDIQTAVTERVSQTDAGDDANGLSQLPAISADGTEVAFVSRASNLVQGDGAGWDLFAHVSQSDDEAPVVSCAHADDVWHAAEVTVACTASDTGSGLADPADASFSLTTSVGAGSETADARTGTHTVCDVAGNCADAGPVGPFRVDRRPPAISISTPADGAVLERGAVVTPVYACVDGGSGTAACSGPAGPLDTTAVGYHELTVTATDAVGNRSSSTFGYWVRYPWGGFVTPPLAHANAGRAIPVEFSLGTDGGVGPGAVAAGFPRTAPVACGSSSGPAGDEAADAIGGGLRYDAASGRFSLVWKTDRSWAGTCRALVVKLDDGSTHALVVQFE